MKGRFQNVLKVLCILLWSSQTQCFSLDAESNTKSSFAVVDVEGKLFIWGNLAYNEVDLDILEIASTKDAFVALLSSGQMKVWGNISNPDLGDTHHINANFHAFVVTLENDHIVCWGPSTAGGDCSGITDEIDEIYSTYEAFAAITSQGSVVTWGAGSFGGNSQNVSNQLQSGAQDIFSTDSAFAAITSAQYLVCWGNAERGGNCAGLVESSNIKDVYSTAGAFAAHTMGDLVVTWGSSAFGGDSSNVDHLSAGIIFMASGETDFIAYTKDSYLVSWGGQGITYKTASTTIDKIYSNFGAFVAKDTSGKLTIWGSPAYGGNYATNTSFAWVYSNKYAFVGVKSDNTMTCWGDVSYGGNCNSFSSIFVKQLAAIEGGFLAVACDGTVVSWGENSNLMPPLIRKPSLISSNHRYSGSDDTMLACGYPSASPTASPTLLSSTYPFQMPLASPIMSPTLLPSSIPTSIPSTGIPTSVPTGIPTSVPTGIPTTVPTGIPTSVPTGIPTSVPTGIPTSVPTGIPTSVPTCPKLYTHEDGTATCVCKAGYFTQFDTPLQDPNAISGGSWSSSNTTCRQCPSNYYSTQEGTETCTQCDWPETTRFGQGNTKCNGYCLCFPQDDLLKVIPPALFVFILCIALANESKYALGIVLFFPTLDVLSDVLYLTTTLYYTRYLCILSVIFLMAPSVLWIHEISSKKAYPTPLVWPFPPTESQQHEPPSGSLLSLEKPKATDFLVITISSTSSTPLYHGTPMKPFFVNHDGIPHLLSFAAIWIGAFLYQGFLLFLLLSWLFLSFLFQFSWFFLGIFLHLTKLFSIGKVQSFWFYFWTGTNDFFCDRDVDIGTLNRDMLAEFLLESLPQLLVQSINNQLTNKWTLIGWISAGLSMFVALNGTYRMLYWMLWMKVPIDQVQMGMALKILGAKPELRHKPTDENGLESGENGISLASRRLSFGSSKIAPLMIEESAQDPSSILPFGSVRAATPIDRSQLHPTEMKIEDVATSPSHPGDPPHHLLDENEAKWRGNIWELLTSGDNSLDLRLTQEKMASVGLGSEAEIRYMNERDIEAIGSTLKAVPRRKLRFLWGGRLVKTHAYLPALRGDGEEGGGVEEEELGAKESSHLLFNEHQDEGDDSKV
jgi:hypothetical protein